MDVAGSELFGQVVALARQDYSVVFALEEEDRGGVFGDVVGGGAFGVEGLEAGQGTDEAVQVVRFEVVRLCRKGAQVGDAGVGDGGLEHVLLRVGGHRGQSGPAARGEA